MKLIIKNNAERRERDGNDSIFSSDINDVIVMKKNNEKKNKFSFLFLLLSFIKSKKYMHKYHAIIDDK